MAVSRPIALVGLVGLGAGIALVSVLVLELLVRITCPWISLQGTDRRLFAETTEEVGEEWRRGARGMAHGVPVEIDALGTRLMPGPDTYDEAWLILGDSVAFGLGVPTEQTFVGLAQREHPGTKFYNAAVVGMAAAGYPRTGRRLLESDPKIRRVTVFFCLNDIPHEGSYGPVGLESWLTTLNKTFRGRSKLYRLVAGLAGHGVVQYFLHDLARYHDIDNRADEVFAPYAETAEIARAAGAQFEVILMPYEHQLRADKPEYWKPQDALRAYLEQRGVAVRDARTWFGGDGDRAHDYYLFGDGLHFDSRGHEAVYRGWIGASAASLPEPVRWAILPFPIVGSIKEDRL